MTRTRFIVLFTSFVGLVSGCLVGEGDERCDPNQRLQDQTCQCIEGTVLAEDGYGCMPCGQHAMADQGECVCMDGYARTDPEGPCMEAPDALGAPCTPETTECPEEFPMCVTEGGESYCSVTCQSSEECPGGFACEAHEGDRICTRPPSGQLASCEAQEDCAAFEASYCSTSTGTCVVPDCSSTSPCHGDFACCDFTQYGAPTLCVPPSVTSDEGACPLDVPRLDESES